MLGIVLVSHGELCKGMLFSLEMICGEPGGQIETVCLEADAEISKFDIELKSAIEKVDSGDGVAVLADLTGGTPFNRAALLAGPSVRLFGGINLAFLLELIAAREDGMPPFSQLLSIGQAGLREYTSMNTDAYEDIL